MTTDEHKAIIATVYAGERTAKQAIAAAREAGLPTPKSWRRSVANAEYITSVHRTFKSTVEPEKKR